MKIFSSVLKSLRRSKSKDVQPEHEPRFQPGEWVTLAKTNPYKGTLKFGVKYRVWGCGIRSFGLYLDKDNSGKIRVGFFQMEYFVRTDPPPITEDGAREYEEIMAAQDLLK